MSKDYLIYMHTSPSGKSYIGQTKDYDRRCKEHQKMKGCRRFYNAIRCYGWDNFTHIILKVGLTLDEANYWEEYYIKEFNTLHPHGYNLTTGGGNANLSEDTKRLMSELRGNFIIKAIEKYGDKYNYDKVKYISSRKKIIITCKKHGDFIQTPSTHLSSNGCPKCGIDINAKIRKLNNHKFIEKAKKIHGDLYSYDKVNYVHSTQKITIVCHTHGDFFQRPNAHLNGRGCQKCVKNLKLATADFIEKANTVHNGLYSYSKVNYTKSSQRVIIICSLHGEFKQIANNHLAGNGCPKCNKLARYSNDTFITKAMKTHGDRYIYDKAEYGGNHVKVIIICKLHGEFYQNATNHLRGDGCAKCAQINKRGQRK